MRPRKTHNPSSQVSAKRLYSTSEAATYLGRTVWAVREMIWAGKIPCVRDGRRILVDVVDMDAWIAKNKSAYTD